jgi:Tfp pilus assembly protein PilN
MIKVNLVGSSRKKATKATKARSPLSTFSAMQMPSTFTPILPILIAGAFAIGAYLWYSSLSGQAADLDKQIRGLEARKAALDAVIKQDQVYATIKKKLENRVKIVEALSKNQLSPILVLDELSQAVEKTRYVWLSNLEQKDAQLTLSGTGTSLSAIADLYTNLNSTGYFKNLDLGTAQESSGNYTFSLKCEFAPPRNAPNANIPAPVAGGN